MFTFALFGTGWRAQFYMRIASLLSDRFQISAVYTHSEERLSFLESMGLRGTTNLEEALSYPHDAVVVASGPKGLPELLEELSRRKETILSETSFLALPTETNEKLKEIPGYAIEQYLHTPLFQAIWEVLPMIGKVDQLRLTMLHNHHAASIVRHLFPDWKEATITGEDFPSHTIKTGSRAGREYGGEKEDYTRKIRIMKGKDWLFLQDFSTNLYRSYLIPSTLEIRGERGTITEKGITFLNDRNRVVSAPFVYHRDEVDKENRPMAFSHISILGKVVYENPYYPVPLNEDEIAMAKMLEEAAEGILTYTIRDAIEDAELGKRL